MRASVVLLLVYASVVAFLMPVLLSRLTVRGTSARLGLASWLVAMCCVVISSVAALSFLIRPAMARHFGLGQWPGGQTQPCTSVAHWVAVLETCVLVLAAVAAVAGVSIGRYTYITYRAWRRTRAHAEAAWLVGRRLPALDALVLRSPRPAAYCVPGRPPTIVITDSALAVLKPAQLAAVLAHERAHLAGRHHLLLLFTRGLAKLCPGVPLFRRGTDEIARLTEMCADDAATRRAGRHTLIAALLAMGGAVAVPTLALAATSTGAPARIRRLLEPPTSGERARAHLCLTAAILGLVLSLLLLVAAAIALTGCRLTT